MPAYPGMGVPGHSLHTPRAGACRLGRPGAYSFNHLLSRQYGTIRLSARIPAGEPAGIHLAHGLDISATLLDYLVRAGLLVPEQISSRHHSVAIGAAWLWLLLLPPA